MSVTTSANIEPLVSREQIGNAIRSALKLYVGRGRRYSVKQLSNGTGIKDRVIECAMEQVGTSDWRPLPQEALASIDLFLGSDFTNERAHLTKQGAFDLPDDPIAPMDLAADNADDNAVVVRAAIDGVFDGGEAPDLKQVGARMIQRGQHLIALGRAS